MLQRLAGLGALLIVVATFATSADAARKSGKPAKQDTTPQDAAGATKSPSEQRPLACEGLFGKDTTHARLATEFGAKNVVFKDITTPANVVIKATVLFDEDPNKRIVVQWNDLKARAKPASIAVEAPSTWTGPGSIRNIEWLNGLTGSAQGDTIVTASLSLNDVISTGAGNDRVTVFAGADTVHFGEGDDRSDHRPRWALLREAVGRTGVFAGARDVQMHPGDAGSILGVRHSSDEAAQEQAGERRATHPVAHVRVLKVGDRGLERLFHVRGQRHVPCRLADASRGGEEVRHRAVVAEHARVTVAESGDDGAVREIERLLEQAIGRARDEGQIPADADPRALARFYGAVVQSLGVMHRASGDVAALRDIAAVAMRAWPAAPVGKRASARKPARPH